MCFNQSLGAELLSGPSAFWHRPGDVITWALPWRLCYQGDPRVVVVVTETEVFSVPGWYVWLLQTPEGWLCVWILKVHRVGFFYVLFFLFFYLFFLYRLQPFCFLLPVRTHNTSPWLFFFFSPLSNCFNLWRFTQRGMILTFRQYRRTSPCRLNMRNENKVRPFQ